jgi:hypothetical protein
MALIFTDPNPAGPFADFQDKDVHTKVFKLTNANFSTAGVNTLVGAIAADASITSMTLWVKTQLAGGSVSAATISVGTASGGTQFVNANAAAFGTAGTKGGLTPITNIYQPYNIPYTTGDIQIWVNGTSTTGNPTSGEMYLELSYVR